MKLTGARYCDCVVWSPNEFVVLRIDLADDSLHKHLKRQQHSLSLEFFLNLLVNGTQKPPFTVKLKMHMTIATVQLPVLIYQRWMLLLRTVMRLGAIVEERMKGR